MKWKRAKTRFAVFFLLMFFLSSVNIVVATPVSDTNVDILFAGDEEIMNGYISWPDPIWWWLGVFYDRPLTEIIEEDCFPPLQSSFEDQLGIDIVFHGWAEWDSDDGTNDAYFMLEEAIKEVGEGYWVSDPSWPFGGYWKFNRGMIWNGIVIDMLVAWTWQDISPDGFAPPQWGAAIVQYWDIPRATFIPQHEISHLYGLLHCSHDWCIMNPSYAWYTNDWQSTCRDSMIEHKERFTRHPLTIDGTSYGTTDPAPGIYWYYHGESVSVMADAYSGYTFYRWVLDGAIRYENPITVTMNSDHTLTAYFTSGGCVAEGTPVTMADGTVKPIEEIKKGDQVLGYDPTTGSYMAENVLDTIKHQVEVLVNFNNGRLRVTPTDQPIFIRNATYEGWVRDPATMQVGWEIYEPKTGTWVTVTSMTYEEGKTRVYDLILDGYTTYIANSLLLMDKC